MITRADTLLVVFLIAQVFRISECIDCNTCVSSTNPGCDILSDTSSAASSSTCSNQCYTSTDVVVTKGCSASSSCDDSSYSISGTTYIKSCCSTELCNKDVSGAIYQCYECDSDTELCPELGFSGDAAVYCGGYCQKRIATKSGAVSVTRRCITSCSEDSSSFFGYSIETYCCQGDLCNHGNRLLHRYIILLPLLFAFHLVFEVGE